MIPQNTPTQTYSEINTHDDSNAESKKHHTAKNSDTLSKAKTFKKQTSKRSPIFIQKAYKMVDTSDPTIIGWSDDGNSFVIKNQDILASTVIPRYFKHNNVQSFIRQLNFYGFRKIKNDNITVTSLAIRSSREICFCHSHFLRGRPDLLVEISKPSSPKISADQQEKQEIQTLKSEVRHLKNIISSLTNDIGALKVITQNLVTKLSDKFQQDHKELEVNKKTKKRKASNNLPTILNVSTETSTEAMLSINNDPISSTSCQSLSPKRCSGIDNSNDINSDDISSVNTGIFSQELCEIGDIWPDSQFGVGSDLSSDDDDIDEYLIENMCFDIMDDSKHLHESIIPPTITKSSELMASSISTEKHIIDAKYVIKLYDSIEMLPDEIKPFYTLDTLIANITDPDCLKKQIDDIFELATEMKHQNRPIPL